MKFKDYTKILSLIVLIFLGCTSSVSNVGIGQRSPESQGDYVLGEYIIINNQTLARRLQIIDIDSRIVNQLMQAHVKIMNKYNTDARFEYQFQWFDSKGFEVATVDTYWHPVLIYGQEVKTLVGLAPNPSAAKFKIHIRKEKPIQK